MTLIKELEKQRKALGMNYSQFAEHLGVSVQLYWAVLRGYTINSQTLWQAVWDNYPEMAIAVQMNDPSVVLYPHVSETRLTRWQKIKRMVKNLWKS